MSAREKKDYYQLLGVDRRASAEEIKGAYHELARVFHPDSHFFDEILGGVSRPRGETDIFKELTAAYNVLIHAEKRAEYDATLPDLEGWDRVSVQEDFHTKVLEQKLTQERSEIKTFGVFGAPQPQEPLAVSDESSSEPPPLSSLIKRNSGLLGWISVLLSKRGS